MAGKWEQEPGERESSGWKQGSRDEEGRRLGQRRLERSKTEPEEENVSDYGHFTGCSRAGNGA